MDNIDIPVATKHGVVVMNTPAGNTISTAEHAFTLMMSMARHIPQAHRSVEEGRFKEGRKAYKGVELYQKTLAILGMGRIGSEFARRAMAFGMRVVAYDPYLAASRAKSMRVELGEDVPMANPCFVISATSASGSPCASRLTIPQRCAPRSMRKRVRVRFSW